MAARYPTFKRSDIDLALKICKVQGSCPASTSEREAKTGFAFNCSSTRLDSIIYENKASSKYRLAELKARRHVLINPDLVCKTASIDHLHVELASQQF